MKKKKLERALEPQRILIIAMRFLGDVLLATPLIHSIKNAYPNAKVDVLIYQNTIAMLEGNPDINELITTPQRPKAEDYKELFKQIFRQYDLSVNTQTSDRRIIYGLLAAPIRISLVPQRHQKGWWKRYFITGWAEFEGYSNHTVLELLKLVDLLNKKTCYSLIPPSLPEDQAINAITRHSLPSQYAVLHMHPQWRYKRWTSEGWIKIANHLISKGFTPVLSGSPEKNEIEYIQQISRCLPPKTINLAGKLSLAELRYIIENSSLFIGPDTGITHLAAATGAPVIAIYGPTNPIIWAPWPYNYQKNINPFHKKGNQHTMNINLIQGTADCIPCQEEGCEQNRNSYSACLDNLEADKIIEIIDRIYPINHP